jgi:CRISPR-associated protein Csb1
MNNSNWLDPATLLASKEHRLTLQATLQPVAGVDRFQPAGFPEIGHVIYDSPKLAGDGRPDKVCIVDSAASMANHLETVCLDGPFGSALAAELAGLPYVECVTDNGTAGDRRLVVTTFSEGHRLASSLFTDGRLIENGDPGHENLKTKLLSEFGLVDLGKRSHPLPQDWWNVFKRFLSTTRMASGLRVPGA